MKDDLRRIKKFRLGRDQKSDKTIWYFLGEGVWNFRYTASGKRFCKKFPGKFYLKIMGEGRIKPVFKDMHDPVENGLGPFHLITFSDLPQVLRRKLRDNIDEIMAFLKARNSLIS